MSKFKTVIYGVLKGEFLIKEDSLKNWRFILFIVGLMLLMIASSHSIDRKVMKIGHLNKDIKELRAEFVDLRSILMKEKLESTIREKVAGYGLKPSENPPELIRVISTKK